MNDKNTIERSSQDVPPIARQNRAASPPDRISRSLSAEFWYNVSMETFPRETLAPWFVTGFVEGDGTFTYSRSGQQIGLYFAVKLTASDLTLLEQIQEFFGGIGTIYKVGRRAPRSNSGYTKTAYYFRVTRNSDLLRVVEHFDHYPLRSSKASAFLVWKEMVQLKSRFRKPDRARLDTLAAQLSSLCIRKQDWR